MNFAVNITQRLQFIVTGKANHNDVAEHFDSYIISLLADLQKNSYKITTNNR